MNYTRRQIIRTARSYVGVPFRHQGRTRDGLDCIGLIIRVAHDLGLSTADFRSYSREPNARVFFDNLARHLTRKPGEPEPGDVLVFALPKYPCHIAIYTDLDTVIHALSKRGSVVEHALSDDWKQRIRSAWEMPGVESWRN